MVFSDHSANQITDLGLDPRTAGTPAPFRDFRPVAAKAPALPVQHRLRLYDYQPAVPLRPGRAQRDPESSVRVMQLRLVLAQVQSGDLLPQGEILQEQLVPGLAHRSDQLNQQGEQENEGAPQKRSLASKQRCRYRPTRFPGPLPGLSHPRSAAALRA